MIKLLLGGLWGTYVPPCVGGWVDRPTLDIPSLDYDFLGAVCGAWVCLPSSLSSRQLGRIHHSVRVALSAACLPFVIEFFSPFPYRHSVFESNFKVGDVLVDRIALVDDLRRARFTYGLYRFAWFEGVRAFV